MSDTVTTADSVKQLRSPASLGFPTLTDQPWWTAADQAELEVLVDEFVNGAWDHNQRCGICSDPTENRWCRPLCQAFDVVVEWRTSRILHSRAALLRGRQAWRESQVAEVLA